MREFRAPGAEIWLFKKKNMDRSIDLAVQLMYVNEDSPNLGSPYFHFLGNPHQKKTLYFQTDIWDQEPTLLGRLGGDGL